ncbi:MAG: dihydroorotate dehydrogenase electron transfer subunit [Culturomica sp.]|jgi:dihydroorotate dehydrogenase electron transfer subunit|nr:dihydroorotate dehydrogenase electron transfer subunit [Culturomica sp.]
MKKIIDFTVRDNRRLNKDMFLLTLHSEELPEMKPGQFVNVRIDNSPHTFLRRPISVHDIDMNNGLLYLLVKIAGEGTEHLSQIRVNEKLNILLPLGNGFTMPDTGKHLLIGGGVGVAPILFLAKEMNRKGLSPIVLVGCRTKEDIVLQETFGNYCRLLHTTEDGSYGETGYPTQHSVLAENFDGIYCCGPEAMMKAVARYATQKNIECEVSLENMMACGLGACLCCVTETKEGNKCVCTEGSVFNIKDLTWQI